MTRDYGEYNVGFGSLAGTLLYEDQKGNVAFIFDISPSSIPGKEWTLELSPSPRDRDGKLTQNEPQWDQKWVLKAFERTKGYAISCGYDVRVSD